MDLINKIRHLYFFSTAAILQSWITNTGMNFLDTAYIFQSNIWMHMSETFSNFLTLLGVGRTWACFMGLEMLYKAVAWVFITVSFHLHLASFFSLGASVLCSVWMSLFFPSWNVCLISQKLQALLAVHSPCLLDKKKKDYSDPSINFFFQGLGHRFCSAGQTAILATMRHQSSVATYQWFVFIADPVPGYIKLTVH